MRLKLSVILSHTLYPSEFAYLVRFSPYVSVFQNKYRMYLVSQVLHCDSHVFENTPHHSSLLLTQDLPMYLVAKIHIFESKFGVKLLIRETICNYFKLYEELINMIEIFM